VTSGAPSGTSGRRTLPPWAVAYVIIGVATLILNTINVLSFLDERSWQNRPIDWWKPAVWEGTSAIVIFAILWMPMLAIRRFPPHGRSWLGNLAIHAALTIPFSLTHVMLMVALRHLAYAIAGETYDFGMGWDTLLYEYRKDVVSYALFAAVFWLTERLMTGPAEPMPEPARDHVVIDEGQRIIRVPPGEVLGARSCGNYVEFLLVDGRRPLMRTTLAGLEAGLGIFGFVRTHRSWLVNASHVVEIEAEGSGDYGLKLGDGTQVPLSRRYKQALDALRARA
jgi:hypothetical protein